MFVLLHGTDVGHTVRTSERNEVCNKVATRNDS
jgi:hypothetical protein